MQQLNATASITAFDASKRGPEARIAYVFIATKPGMTNRTTSSSLSGVVMSIVAARWSVQSIVKLWTQIR
ncbi:hypothetical protein X961_4108 [Burkholderia pseudomallei MSHR5613]|nr:hypothetical protein X961_4108 [Burkholderia pseudomallei MSHR5613]